MSAPLSAEAKALIDRPNFAHLATLMADGSPHSVPVWVGREGDRLVVCTSEGSLKGRNTRRDPRVALSIVDLHNPYEEVQLRGRGVGPPRTDCGGPRWTARPGDRGAYCALSAIPHSYIPRAGPPRALPRRARCVVSRPPSEWRGARNSGG